MNTALTFRLRVRLSRAVGNLNAQGADNVLDEVFGLLPLETALGDVVLPFLSQLEADVAGDPTSVARVGLATVLLERRLWQLASGWDAQGKDTVVVGNLGDDRHTFGAIAFGLVLRDRGWRILYLDSVSEPAPLANAASASSARAIVVIAHGREAFDTHAGRLGSLAGNHRVLLAGAGADDACARTLGAELLEGDPVTAALGLDDRRERSWAAALPQR